MSHEARQTRRFSRQYKKLHDNIAVDVDDAVDVILTDPKLGERKKGDLADLFVYKFRGQGQLYLLGYTVDDGIRLVYLEAISSHDILYRDLKR
ncbi:type II toxin-antitoxin system RelE/ParE family toxin [Collimonas antrihumi]|uniref:type II toxin-antitoxin system RelE/ParE family toxin n=1 Tax=Collimonas antrihumi TaxID=1940615 RepID=UPI001B8DA17E|nr:type II toxin-antitoxin system RelE/ParE family toxin [Collimonas antrihumi]